MMGDNAFEWLEGYLESALDSQDHSDNDEMLEEDFDALGIDDTYEEGFSGKDMKNAMKSISRKVTQVIDKIIEKIQQLLVQFKIKYSQLHFKASMKKLGKSCVAQIKTAGVPKEYATIVKASLQIDQKCHSETMAAWTRMVSGKMSADEYDKSLENIRKKGVAATDALSLRFSAVVEKMSDGVLMRTESVLSEYDRAITSLVDAETAATQQTVKRLEELKKKAAVKAGMNAMQDAVESATNKAASVLSSIHMAISNLINKITAQIAKLGDKDLRHAAGSKGKDTKGKTKTKIIKEEATGTKNNDGTAFEELSERLRLMEEAFSAYTENNVDSFNEDFGDDPIGAILRELDSVISA